MVLFTEILIPTCPVRHTGSPGCAGYANEQESHNQHLPAGQTGMGVLETLLL